MADNKNLFADFAFDKLPTELLVKIFRHTRTNSALDVCKTKYPYPVALAQVCRHWRNVALCAPTLWTDIRIVEYNTKETREAAHVYLERSKTCPIFLTWFSDPEQSFTNIQRVINDLIIPGAGRWQRITLFAGDSVAGGVFLTSVEPLDFPILRDVEISCTVELPPFYPAFCRNAPLLRRCRFRSFPSFPPLPSNLVVLDCTFWPLEFAEFDLDPLLEFLPHVAHSLEHLRFGPPIGSNVRFTPRTSRIILEHLKSLLIKDSYVIMDHISTPNLTYLTVLPPHDAMNLAKVFEGFSAPMLRSIQFHDAHLLPILNAHDFPSIFPQLESITLSGCTDELAFALLLGPHEPKESSSSQEAPEHREVQNPFPNLKELTISDMSIWASLQAAIEKRLKNGDKSLRKIRLPKKEATEAIMPHLRQWLPAQGIELVLYESGELSLSPPEFQDDFCNKEAHLFLKIMERIEWERYDEENEDADHEYWDEFYDGYDVEEEEDDDDYDYEDFYEG